MAAVETTNRAHLADSVGEPNLPEVSGTSFPLLTTVLAGFAVTIAVQLIIRPDATETLPILVTAAIVIFLTSTLTFISSIVFAVNAQSHNYLPFMTDDDRPSQMYGVEDHIQWIIWLHQGWDAFHRASIITFYSGIMLLLAGVNIIVWEFVGPGTALIVLALILFNILVNVTVGLRIHRTKERSAPQGCRPRSEITVHDRVEKQNEASAR
jgi:hypothetical protein